MYLTSESRESQAAPVAFLVEPFVSPLLRRGFHSHLTTLRPSPGGFRSEVQPRRQHWFLNEKSGFPFRTAAFCSVSRGQRRLGEKEYRAPSVTPGVALRDRTQAERLRQVRSTCGIIRRDERIIAL